MTISNEERMRRRESLGASDLPAILGLQLPWRSAADVQLSKLYELEEKEDENVSVWLGNAIERPLCEWASKKLGMEFEYPPDPIIDDMLPIHANLDALVPGKAVVEAKLTGQYDEWGDEGTDQVPDGVITQVHQQMYLAGVGLAIIPVAFVGVRRARSIYQVERNDELLEELLRHGEGWWLRHVVERQPVPDELPTIATLSRVRRQPGSSTIVPRSLILGWDTERRKRLAQEKIEEAEQARVLAALGDTEAAVDEHGNELATYLKVKPRAQRCEQCGHEKPRSPYRTLRSKIKGEETE